LLGVSVDCACPKGYYPAPEVVEWCREVGRKTGATFNVIEDPVEAVKGADVIYSDVWVSMGVEHEKEQRLIDLHDYQVNLALFEKAKSDCIFMHCLPAHRGEEVTDDVCDHPRSVIFDEAENRLHAQAALILCLFAAWK
ncbi:MAG TPA: ornithine carbamoyltransferase, partial [Myxococcota bacterium]|nr:ornithine carbamoyltransferase [Myxococcota bacterium]